jgi:methionyl-tRNA formyltransferase
MPKEESSMEPRIMFMGTPDIAATCLEALLAAGCEVVSAVTRIDKPKGRRAILTPPPVKVVAEAHGIPVFQPRTLRDGAFFEYLDEVKPDLILVVAFGMLLPPEVIAYPRLGCINVHASLLPKYRGAAPIQRSIMDGESETGITIMYMDEGLDTGDMIAKEKTPISDSDTLETVHDRLAEIGARMLVETVFKAKEGQLSRMPQDGSLATYARKIEREDCRLDFRQPSRILDATVRGLSPMPLAFFSAPDGKTVKVIAAHPTEGKGEPGTVLSVSCAGDGEIVIAAGEGALAVTRLLPEGKSRMTAAEYLRGRRLNVGEVLS